MSEKCCFEKVPGWWAQPSGYGLKFHYCLWQTTDRAVLATLTTRFEEYKELLIDIINNLTWHSYLAKVQARYVKSKESLCTNKFMMLGDFAENCQYLIQDEIQGFYWSKEYCTLHPLVIYCKDADGKLQHYSLFHFRWQHTRYQFCSQDSDTTGGILQGETPERHKDLLSFWRLWWEI